MLFIRDLYFFANTLDQQKITDSKVRQDGFLPPPFTLCVKEIPRLACLALIPITWAPPFTYRHSRESGSNWF